MGDIRLIWNPATGTADIAMAGPDLMVGDDLETAIIISLWSDATADPGDILPVNTDHDPRGWWARPIGSKLWQIFGRIRNQQTLNDARDFAQKALQWLIDDGIASSVSVATSFYGSAGIGIVTTVTRPNGTSSVYSYVWGGIS